MKYTFFLTAAMVSLTACGGGGGSSPAPEAEQPVDRHAYTTGDFPSSTGYKSLCETPRSGINPATDAAYDDQQGEVADELFWLRSWSDETYLWYDEILDQNPLNFSEPTVYFQELKTEATTPSGNEVDRFHFTMDTDEWQSQISSGITLSYGAQFIHTRTSIPRETRIVFVEDGSPADLAGWERGDFIVELDGVSIETGSTTEDIATLNAAIIPSEDDLTHSISIRKLSGETITATVTATEVAAAAVLESDIFSNGDDLVGYMVFNDHNAIAEAQLMETMQTFETAGVDDLIVDLRYNGGGYLVIAAQLAAMVAGDNADNEVFEVNVYNDKLGTTHPVTGEESQPFPFVDFGVGLSVEEGTDLPKLHLNRVFVISSAGTCSASEAFINGLRGIDVEVILIGNTTCGKPYGFFPQDNCGTTYFTIQTRGENAKGFGDFVDGFSPANGAINIGVSIPGCFVQDDLDHQLGDVAEQRLATALYYRDNGSCPTSSATGNQKSFYDQEEVLVRSPFKEMKIY